MGGDEKWGVVFYFTEHPNCEVAILLCMAEQILIQFNYFGAMITASEIESVLKADEAPVDSAEEHRNQILQDFFGISLKAVTREMLERYVEVSANEHFTNIVPAIDNLIKPLISAKRNYCFGDYPATIASCGIMSEMMAILVWQMHNMTLKGEPITEDQEKGLLGSTFEKLGQERRLQVLKTIGAITDEQIDKFNQIRGIRRTYLHFWEKNVPNERGAALQCLKMAFLLFKEITGVALNDASTVKANPLLVKWFARVMPSETPVEKSDPKPKPESGSASPRAS